MKKTTKLRPWQTLSSKTVHKNRWYEIRREKYVMPTGKIGEYNILDSHDIVFIVPVVGNNIILEEQYRYPNKKWFIEIPGGMIEKEYSIVQNAKKELLEETGYKGKLKKIGIFFPHNGLSREKCTVFLATDLKLTDRSLEDTEKIRLKKIPLKVVYDMLDSGKIFDGMTIASLALARKYLINNAKG